MMLNKCPGCKSYQIITQHRPQGFVVLCLKCGFKGELFENPVDAGENWNNMERKDSGSTVE